jgi:uncharacterized protein YlaN (UPF0358 family)
MGAKTQFSTGIIAPAQSVTDESAELDLVVPFTTPELTRVALDAASRMSAGLNAVIRLIRVQVVPYPLPPDQSPVYIEFLKEQMAALRSDLPVAREIRLARSFEDGLRGTLAGESVVILAAPKRPWKTRYERLAVALRRAGHVVVLVNPAVTAAKQEAVHA